MLAEQLAQEYDIPLESSNKITSSYLRQFRKCPDNGSSSLDNWRTKLWKKALGKKYSHLAKSIYERWLHLRYHYLALTPDIITMIDQLKEKYFLGLITNGPSNAQWEKIHKLHLRKYFDVILVSNDLPWEKPDPRIFKEACQFLNVVPSTCIMVGDKLETDILGGIEAGLHGTVLIRTTDEPRISVNDPRPDFILKRVIDLVDIINRYPEMPELEDSSSNSSDGN